jgi:hypothetical protein
MDTGRLSEQDVSVLLRLVIALEGELLAGAIDPELSEVLHRQFRREGLLDEQPPSMDHEDLRPAQLRLGLTNLNQRLRYALGDYDTPQDPDLGWANQYFRFASMEAAEGFLSQARAAGERGLAPTARPANAAPESWAVAVVVEELMMTAAFDAHIQALTRMAADHSGRPDGSSGPGATTAT